MTDAKRLTREQIEWFRRVALVPSLNARDQFSILCDMALEAIRQQDGVWVPVNANGATPLVDGELARLNDGSRQSEEETPNLEPFARMLELALHGTVAALRAAQSFRRGGEMSDDLMNKLVTRFLTWPLPESVCADLIATRRCKGRSGTNLLTHAEAEQMLRYVLKDFLEAQLPTFTGGSYPPPHAP